MIKKNRIYEDKRVLRAIFDEVFLNKELLGNSTSDKNNILIKTLLEGKYFNKETGYVSLGIFRLRPFRSEDTKYIDGFYLSINESINGRWFSNIIRFNKEQINESLKKLQE